MLWVPATCCGSHTVLASRSTNGPVLRHLEDGVWPLQLIGMQQQEEGYCCKPAMHSVAATGRCICVYALTLNNVHVGLYQPVSE